ncbi:MAG: tetratricopeptide repeat protein [bacterium]
MKRARKRGAPLITDGSFAPLKKKMRADMSPATAVMHCLLPATVLLASAVFTSAVFPAAVLPAVVFPAAVLPAAVLPDAVSQPGAQGQDKSEKKKILSFADHLFETGEYYRAITEYSRFLFFFPDDPLVKLVRLKIAYAYQRGEQWKDARQRFDDLARDYAEQEIGREAMFQSAETLRLEKNYPEALSRYQRFIEAFPKDERVDLAFFRLGCIRLDLHEWLVAAEDFSKVGPNSRFSADAAHLGQESKRLASLPLKKPALAGILSGLLPGAGQIYSRRYRDGLTALLVNAGFIWGAAEAFEQDQNVLGSILLAIESGWYAGNIYSAVSSTTKFNRREIEKNLAPLRERCSFSLKIKEDKGEQEGKTEPREYHISFNFWF